MCEWIEIAGVTFSRIATLTGSHEDEALKPCESVRYDDMHEHSPGLFQCLSKSALILITPDQELVDETPGSCMVEVVFRPLGKEAAA